MSERERLFIEQGAPRSKGVLSFDYVQGDWHGLLKFIYFGTQTLGTFSGPPVPNQRYGARLGDVSRSHTIARDTRLTIGAANVLDRFPTRQDHNETDNGHVFESVQFGLNGASVYLRLFTRF